MIPPRFQLYLHNDKKTLLMLALGQFMTAALFAAAMKALSQITAVVFLQKNTLKEAAPALLVLLFLLLLREIVSYWQKQLQHKASLTFRQMLRHKLNRRGLTNPQAAENSPLLLTLACESTETLDADWQILIPTILSLLIDIPFLLLIFFFSDWLTALICLLTLPIAPFLLYLLSSLTKKRSETAWVKLQQLTHDFHELVQTIPMLKIFQQDKVQRQNAQMLMQDFSKATMNVLELAFLASFVLELITTLAIALIAVTIGLRLLNGELDFATGFFILLLLPEFYRPLRQSGTAFHTAMESNTAAAKIDSFLTKENRPPREHHESLRVPPMISVHNLTFTYPQRHTPTLTDLSLQIPAGKITLLVGSSGCGKSTLLSLLAGIHAPTSGKILLEDQPLPTMHPASKAKLIGYLPQEPHLYQGTLLLNLLLFQEAPVERCIQALRLAQLEDFYQQLPQGLETIMGDGGQKLSQGQLKRLGLARLILQNNPILLMDEPTTGLDENTEKLVLKAISVLAKRRTVVISSHHEAVRALADHIINLNNYLPKEDESC